MNTKSVISGLMAVCMMASAPAFAQRHDYGGDRHEQVQRGQDQQRHHDRGYSDRGERHHRYDRHDRHARYDRHDRQDRYDHHDRYRGSHHGYSSQAYYGARHDGYRHEMRRGERLPDYYRGSRYVVNDWRGRHLSAPPRGYHWVQANNDYVLAAIATGIIAQVLLNN